MKTLFDPAREREILDRVGRLTPESPRQWGTLTAPRMVCHLIDAFRVPLYERTVTVRPGFATNRLVRHAMIFWIPWPKGKIPTIPEYYLETQPAHFASDVASLKACAQRAAERGRAGKEFQSHPAFGDLSRKQWGALMYLHTNHHLTQFGV